jgi:hypothetical protein
MFVINFDMNIEIQELDPPAAYRGSEGKRPGDWIQLVEDELQRRLRPMLNVIRPDGHA